MKIKKIIAAALVLLMALTAVPMASLAEGVSNVTYEARQMSKLDKTWAVIDAAEAKAMEAGMTRSEVISAVYEAALNIENVDVDSFSAFTKDGFFFNVDGMYCSYNYRLRNELRTEGVVPVAENEGMMVYNSKGEIITAPAETRAVNTSSSPNVYLVAPYYGHDSSFTDQYKNEAQSIAAATGGTYTLIQSTNATGPNIAANYTNKGVVIYDSHGVQDGSSSYLCLTSSSGITTTDYNNGWAVNAGSSAYIDGRYIQNHVSGKLSNCFVWMAICEGMKTAGKGTTGTALLAAGAGTVYGYSQSVSFTGDYLFEEAFWTEMKKGATTAEAIQVMKNKVGQKDPYSSPAAWPIVMSPMDSFPSNPDSAQTVNSNWVLIDNSTPVDLVSYSLDKTSEEMYIGESRYINFATVPANANQYELVWTSSNTNVAIVDGTNSNASITGTGAGNATITCTVMVNGSVFGRSTVAVTVREDTSLKDALNVSGGNLSFTSIGDYAFADVTVDGKYCAQSGNVGVSDTTSTLTSVLNMKAGETLSFEYYYSSESNYDWYNFTVNGEQKQHLSGTTVTDWNTYTFTAPSAGTYTFEWSYSKDTVVSRGDDCVRIDNVAYSGTVNTDPTATPVAPTATPVAPTATPTVAPTAAPTVAPTAAPTTAPTAVPTTVPDGTYVFRLTDTLENGKEYMIVSSDEAGSAYAAGGNSGYTTVSDVTIVRDSCNTYIVASDVADNLIWTSEQGSSYSNSDYTVLKNNGDGRYLGTLGTSGLYTWSGSIMADGLSYASFQLMINGSYSNGYITWDGTNFINSSDSEAMVYLYVKDIANCDPEPTVEPTVVPTAVPTEVPTAVPTEVPTAEPIVLTAPTVSATIVNGKPVISWNAVNGAESYDVYRAIKGGSYTFIGSSNTTDYTDTDSLNAGSKYYYKVCAVDENGNMGPLSNYAMITAPAATVVLTAPTVSATLTNGKPVITWTNVNGAASYEIYRAPKGGSYAVIGTAAGTAYTDNASLTTGTTYYYKVRAIGENGNAGPLSNYASVKVTATTALTAPSITAKLVNGKPVITWNAVNGAASYEIQRAPKGGSYTTIGTTDSTSYTDTDSLTAGAKYYYKVRAIGENGNAGPLSSYAMITATSVETLSAPTVSATIANGMPVISWTAVNGAASYEVQRAPKGGSYTIVGTTSGMSYTDSETLTAGGKYYYKVRAIGANGNYGEISAYAGVTVPAKANAVIDVFVAD